MSLIRDSMRDTRLKVFLLLLTLCLFPVMARSAEAPLILTFATFNGKIALEGSINGKPCRLMLDTGASSTTLLPASAKRLGIDVEPSIDDEPNQKGTIRSLEIQTLRLKNLPCDIEPWRELSNGNKVSSKKADGVLGMDILADYAVGMDFTQKTLVLWKAGHLDTAQIKEFGEIIRSLANKATSNAEQWTELTFTSMMRKGGWFFLHVFVNQTRMDMVIDLGAETTIVRSRSARTLQFIGQSQTWKAKGDSAEHEVKTGLVRQLKVGETVVDYPMIKLTDYFAKEKEAPDILGRDVFVNRRIILDFPGMALYVSSKQKNQTDIITWLHRLGILHRVTSRGIIIEAIIDSPAYRAGLRGDCLLKSLNKTLLRPSVPLEDQAARINLEGGILQLEVFNLSTYQWLDLSLPLASAYSIAPPSMEQIIAVPMDESEKDMQIYKLSFGGIWLPSRVKATELKAYQGKLDNPWTLPDGSKLYPFKSDGRNVLEAEAKSYEARTYNMQHSKLVKMIAGTRIVASPSGTLWVLTPRIKKRAENEIRSDCHLPEAYQFGAKRSAGSHR